MAYKISQSSIESGAQLLKRIGFNAFKNNEVHLDEDSKQLIMQLRNNVSRLEDMNGRLEFMMDEIQGLIKTRYN